ncbi:hypothetical protein ACFU6R_03145 [Streptomyces sp. NPDC057499]|uniref:hypothetical protein n=1 Tax=Streptomyces sp. NPDC057499 TaxID=3346150 RepID=UPI0036A56FC1
MPSLDLDTDPLYEIATRSLVRPSDALFWDDRLFTTHGAILHWCELGDDILEESNYRTALDRIRAAADSGRPDAEVSDAHVIDASARHFAFGSLRTIYVQVREDADPCKTCAEGQEADAYWVFTFKSGREVVFCDGCRDEFDELGLSYEPRIPAYTAAFTEAAEILTALAGYPVLDESDYSEREWNAYQETLTEAVEHAQKDYWDDSDQEAQEIAERYLNDYSAMHRTEWIRAEDVNWAVVAKEYAGHRDSYFTELANAHLNAPIAGQPIAA